MRPTILGIVILVSGWHYAAAQDKDQENPSPMSVNPTAKEGLANNDARFQRFTERMSNVKLIGRFTIIGKKEDGPLAKEEYTIRKVEKLPEGDQWLFLARIKYGQHDLELPLPLDVKWAGDTPVITLDDLTIPGLGTFSSRVVLHDDKYSGTWRHDKVSGHLFGVIEKVVAAPEASAPKK
jgi:hypothetical protein